jgi:hypothetical protein
VIGYSFENITEIFTQILDMQQYPTSLNKFKNILVESIGNKYIPHS